MNKYDRDFIVAQIAVLSEHRRMIRSILDDMDMRLEEIEYNFIDKYDSEADTESLKAWAAIVNTRPLEGCDCDACLCDSSYRMD